MTDSSYPSQTYGTPDPSHDATAVMGRRILAWVLDLVVYAGLSLALFAMLAEYVEIPDAAAVGDACELVRANDPSGDLVTSCLDVSEIPIEGLEDRVFITGDDDNAIQSLASIAYFVFFVLLQGLTGGSPGKLLIGLRVVDEQGRRAGVGRSLVRTLAWIVDAAPWFLPLVGFIVGLTTTGHRRVGDMVAKTYVVSRRDQGTPVRPHHAEAPAGAPAWGASTPAWQDPSQVLPPSPPSSDPAAGPAPTALTTVGPHPGGPSTSGPLRPGDFVDPAVPESVVPDISGIPGESPAPPSTAGISTPPDHDDPLGRPGEAPFGDSGPTDEAALPADVAPPEIGVNPEWWSGPEADPAEESALAPEEVALRPDAPPDDHEPGMFDDPSPAPIEDEIWAPPLTPNDDFGTTDDASPTAGPAPFVAPGTDPRAEAPTTPQVNPMPPPQWDQARNTYIQWDPDQQMWLQWDARANRWKLIDT
ncbi:MAG: RDD family protein [Acidimicrobiales bacterium]